MPADLDRLRASAVLHDMVRTILRTRKNARCEYRLTRRDGGQSTLLSEGSAILDAAEAWC